MSWWANALNAQQFMNATLPHILKTVEALSNNIGRLAIATEESNFLKKGSVSIGGNLEYLERLVEEYGSATIVGDVIRQETEKTK